MSQMYFKTACSSIKGQENGKITLDILKCFEIWYLRVIFVIKYEISYPVPTFLCQ